LSLRIHEEYENGKEYYAWYAKKLQNLPVEALDQPAAGYLQWHQDEIFLG